MVVPDFELIAEIMLVAEGFIEARVLARKFLTLYTLCKELLSKQDHYDWGLRAIKSVLVVAGTLKRGDKGRPEDQVCYVTIEYTLDNVCRRSYMYSVWNNQ
jgi:dynein heavy chain